MENCFSSTDLFHKLCSKQNGAVGNMHQNRKAEVMSTKLKMEEHVSVYTKRERERH
jgi:hypothetical protein